MKNGIVLAAWFACVSLAASAQGDELADAPSTPRHVHVRVRSRSEAHVARVYLRSEEHGARLLCTTPCTTDVGEGDVLRVAYAGNDDEKGTDVTVLAAEGEDLDVEVTPRPSAPLVGSIAMIAAGALTIVGGLILGVRQLKPGPDNPGGAFVPAVLVGTGVLVGLGGLIWLRSQSNGPRLETMPARSDDAAPSARRDPWLPAGAAGIAAPAMTWQVAF